MKDESMSYLEALKEIKRLKGALDKIRAEVKVLGKDYLGCPQPQVVCDDVIKIIDKYRGETDGNS